MLPGWNMPKSALSRVDELLEKKPKLDLRDKKILAMLSEDSRMPLTAIARKVRMSRDTVDYRIKRLASSGIILGFAPQINLGFFGYSTYHIFMVIDTLNEARKNALISALSGHPNTRSVMEYHDTWDLEWVLVARSLKEFDTILIEITKDFKDVINRKDKLAIIKGLKSIQLPGTLYRESQHSFRRTAKREKVKAAVDETDIELLRALSQNSRLSTYEIAKVTGISPDAVGYRIKKMVAGGIIYGFTILTNLSALNYHLYTFCINVRTFDVHNEMRFREFITQNPNILRAVKVLGDWDLLIYITADSQESFHQTFKETQQNLREVISDYQTWAAYKEHVYNNFPKAVAESQLRKFQKTEKV